MDKLTNLAAHLNVLLTDLEQVPLWLRFAAAATLLLVLAVLLGVLSPPRYAAPARLFTPAEWLFYRVLDAAVGTHYLIFPKVRMADLLTPQQTINRRAWWRAFTKVSSKHVDISLIDRRTGAILAAIELDDRSHARQDRKDRDRFVDRAFAQAGIPLLRIPAARSYDRRQLAERVSAVATARVLQAATTRTASAAAASASASAS